jgi:phosphoglycolate phosphatase-like HAD superfamily hydrolase
MKAIRAILFDLDGTIFDVSERDAYARYRALNDLGYNVSLEDVRKRYGRGSGPVGIVKELGIKLTERQEKKYIETSFAHFTERENALNCTKIHDGAYKVLSTLSKKYRLVLVTSRNILSSTEEELEWFNIKTFFTLIITREVAAKYFGVKDIPLLPFQQQRTKLYKCAIGLTGIDPEEMLCIADAVSELEPAKNLGIRTIGVLTGFSSNEDMKDASIPTIEDIRQLLKVKTL